MATRGGTRRWTREDPTGRSSSSPTVVRAPKSWPERSRGAGSPPKSMRARRRARSTSTFIRVDGSNGSGTTLVVRNPFALTGTVAVDPAGDAVYFLEPILPTRRGPWGARFSLTKTNASGDTVYSLALRNEGRELRRQDVDDVVAQIYSGLQASSRPLREAAFRKAFLERIQLPAAMRGYDAVVAGSDGWVWVRRATLSLAGGSAEWEVLDPDGVERGTVTVPAGGTVVLVTAVGAWLLGEDGFGIPFLKWTPINLADLPMP